MTVRVGTSGWTYKSWRGTFYPSGVRVADQFAYYCEQFDTVELNGSYYRWPADSSVEKWRDQMPTGFEMAVKASRYLTHYRKLRDPGEWIERIDHTMTLLGDRAGPLLVQLPADLHRDDERLGDFLQAMPSSIRVAVEFQDPSWLDDEVFSLLDRYGAGFVISVIAGKEPILRATGRLVYVRFHNSDPSRRYGGSFSDHALAVWAERLTSLASGDRPAYAYFNNDERGYAARNASKLRELLG